MEMGDDGKARPLVERHPYPPAEQAQERAAELRA
jgi:hypothetical protein